MPPLAIMRITELNFCSVSVILKDIATCPRINQRLDQRLGQRLFLVHRNHQDIHVGVFLEEERHQIEDGIGAAIGLRGRDTHIQN